MGKVLYLRPDGKLAAIADAADTVRDALRRVGLQHRPELLILDREIAAMRVKIAALTWLGGLLKATSEEREAFRAGLAATLPAPPPWDVEGSHAYLRGLVLRRRLRGYRPIRFLPPRARRSWRRAF